MTIRLESLSLLPNCLIETVAARIRRALPHVAAERLVIAPDCGFKYLPRDIAYAKMAAMVTGAALVRTELGGASLSR